jgi:DNA ligase-1
LVFDGELYNHDLKHDFNKITSLVKKTKPTEEDLKESANIIQYWIYDIVDTTKTFVERIHLVENLIKYKTLQVVPTGLAKNEEDLDALYAAAMEYGFEGQMVRIDAKYENKRSKNLLKRKEFQDREYTILDIIPGEGNKNGFAGAMLFKNELGIEFTSNIKGDRAYLKELLENKNEYIGKEATVKYFNLTPPPNCLPRFPYVTSIRDFE